MKEIFNKEVEREIYSNKKIDMNLFKKKSSAKTPKGLVIGTIRKIVNIDDISFSKPEVIAILQDLFRKISNLETSERVRFESWRGKSGIKIWDIPDKIIVEFASKRDKNEKPKIQRKSYLKQEINKMIICINKLKDEFNNQIPSRRLGEEYFKGNWDIKVFSKRPEHIKFTHLLNILDYYKIIHYNRNGITSILRNVREIQEVLK